MATGEAHSFLLKVETKTPAGFNPEKLNGRNSEQRAPIISLSQLKVASPCDSPNYAALLLQSPHVDGEQIARGLL